MRANYRFACAVSKTPTIASVIRLLGRYLRERSGVQAIEVADREAALWLDVQPGVGAEGFRIEADAAAGRYRIIGHDERGLLYGVGKFLRASTFREGAFEAGAWQGVSAPRQSLRGMYFATHYFNCYHVGGLERIQRLIEDLALWGGNTLTVWFDMNHFHGLQDPQAQRMTTRLKQILRAANSVGMGAGLMLLANEAYADSPMELRGKAFGAYGTELCPSKPGAMELMLRWREEMFAAFADIDLRYLVLWPYDTGGCNCDHCRPWGCNGFLRMSEPVARLARRYFPQARIVLSTWCFDTNYSWAKVEWKGLAQAFARRPDWVDLLLADNSGDEFPPFPLTHGVPGGLPLINFPEISMYRHYPWGGFGANPLPRHLQKLWDSVGRRLKGGLPYSEGIYEDINKAIALQLYWNPERPTADIVREYLAFEFSPEVVNELAEAADLMERNCEHYWKAGEDSPAARICTLADPAAAMACEALVIRAEAKLTPYARQAWRWRLFRLRAAIDAELARGGGLVTPAIDKCLNELTTMYEVSPISRHAPIRKSAGWSPEDERARLAMCSEDPCADAIHGACSKSAE